MIHEHNIPLCCVHRSEQTFPDEICLSFSLQSQVLKPGVVHAVIGLHLVKGAVFGYGINLFLCKILTQKLTDLADNPT